MSNSIKVPGRVLYPPLYVEVADTQYAPYATFVNGAIRRAIGDRGGWAPNPTSMDGDWYECTVGGMALCRLDSPWGNDHYYVYVDGMCVYHCQDTPGRTSIQAHTPGRWIDRMAALMG